MKPTKIGSSSHYCAAVESILRLREELSHSNAKLMLLEGRCAELKTQLDRALDGHRLTIRVASDRIRELSKISLDQRVSTVDAVRHQLNKSKG